MMLATQTMRAIRVSGYGGPEQLKLERIEHPQPQAGEVLLRVHAAGVNPIDWKIRQGLLKDVLPMTFPSTPGIEVAGVVEDVGPGVTAFAIGQAVFGQSAKGAYAEYVAVSVEALALKPQTLSFAEAAAVPVGATTAWRALFEYGGLTSAQRVLIQGAAGGVGLFAVQLAKWKGAQVIGTASTANLDFVRSLGADTVVDYTTTPVESVVQDMDLVLDGVGGETLSSSLAAIRRGGTLISTAAPPPQEQARMRGVRAMMIHSQPSSALLQTLTQLLDEGRLKVPVETTFPLSKVQQAHERSQSRHGRGRIVLQIADEGAEMMNETTLQGVLDRLEITDVVNRVATYADMRDWARVRDCFTDEIDIDYTSLNGGSPAHLSADTLVEQWRAGLSGLQATQHMISNHLITVTGNEATCLAYVQAQHYLPNDTGEPTWTLGGRYTYLLIRTAQGWKIRSSTLTVLWAKGNQHVMTLAPQQVTPTQQG